MLICEFQRAFESDRRKVADLTIIKGLGQKIAANISEMKGTDIFCCKRC